VEEEVYRRELKVEREEKGKEHRWSDCDDAD
jgi:hypothetical protein